MTSADGYRNLIAGFAMEAGAPQLIDGETEAALIRALEAGGDRAALDALAAVIPPKPVYARGTRCFIPPWLEIRKTWGIACQLYELRSSRNVGIGDFEDLARLCEIFGAAGADFVGVTPLHALFLADPEATSPFSPSNRRFLNSLYIALEKVPGVSELKVPEEDGEFVDYAAVSRFKLGILRDAWKNWTQQDSFLSEEFEAFRAERGEMLRLHALFEAISAEMVERGYGAEWTSWPDDFQSPETRTVQYFASTNGDDVAFHEWLQWLADRQLKDAADRARAAGMRIGLYLDMAVGEAPGGSATWSRPQDYIQDATIGAPPDYFSTEGQGWGVAGFSPLALWQQDFAPLLDLIRGASRHAGALRIDHAMALWQLFFIPYGSSPAQGAYLRFPLEDMVERLAALSRKLEVIMIGEDLGHVPDGFREAMSAAAILSNSILYFEQDKTGRFLSPERYPRQTLACLSTHDLPTLRGWWSGKDIELRRDYKLIDEESAAEQALARTKEREAMVQLVSNGRGSNDNAPEVLELQLAADVHRKLAQSSAMLVAVRLADIVGEQDPTNLPGTHTEYPNWRRKLPVTLEELQELPLFTPITDAMRGERHR